MNIQSNYLRAIATIPRARNARSSIGSFHERGVSKSLFVEIVIGENIQRKKQRPRSRWVRRGEVKRPSSCYSPWSSSVKQQCTNQQSVNAARGYPVISLLDGINARIIRPKLLPFAHLLRLDVSPRLMERDQGTEREGRWWIYETTILSDSISYPSDENRGDVRERALATTCSIES